MFIDWANVYGWKKSLKSEVDISILYKYLKTYKEIKDIYLYFGKDNHPKSGEFLSEAEKIGYKVITKPVKYIFVEDFKKQKVYRRKCDFDMEVCIDVHQKVSEEVESFVFFTGDGDFEPLYKLLIKLNKQVIVVYTAGHLGREIWDITKGLFKIQIKNLIDI